MIYRRLMCSFVALTLLAGCTAGGSSNTLPTERQIEPSSGAAVIGQYQQNVASVKSVCGKAIPPKGQFKCFALLRTDIGGGKAAAYHGADFVLAEATVKTNSKPMTSPYYGPIRPVDIARAYNLPISTGGTGQVIAIVDAFDDPNAESDMAVYRKTFGIPACTTANKCFAKLSQTGGHTYPAPDPGWAGEISLDLDMASATCWKCKVVLIEANSNSTADLDVAELEALKVGAHYVSNSYGGPESKATDPAYDGHPGRVITASSGDNGFAGGTSSPANYAGVISVGGTSLYPDVNARGWTETAWSGGGSGCSIYVPRPAWQLNVGCANGTREETDISAVADPFTGVYVYETYPSYGWTIYGGTSVSSPLIVAAMALSGRTGGGAAIWSHYGTASFTDVTIGANGYSFQCSPVLICRSMPGYDGPTGVGTPYGITGF